jgi:hypothetical protein
VYVSYTRVDTTASPVDNAEIVAEEMVTWLRDVDGFEGFLMLQGETTTIGLTFWESRDVAERHRVARMQFVERVSSVAGVQIQERLEFEVAFAELGPRLASFSS